jgi:hypothetical protein
MEVVMQLKVRRGQKSGMTGKVIFTLDVLIGLSNEERTLVDKYKLWNELAYSHASAEAHAEAAQGGSVKALGALMLDRALKKQLTVKHLVSGEHVECKDLGELLAVEEQIRIACANVKRYLDVATSFDGREEVTEVSHAA